APLGLGQERLDVRVDLRAVVLAPAAAAAPAIGVFLGLAGRVEGPWQVRGSGGVSPDLAADGARVALHDPGDAAARVAAPLQHGQGVSFGFGELVVHAGSSLAGVIPSSLPAHLSFFGGLGCCTYFVNSRLQTPGRRPSQGRAAFPLGHLYEIWDGLLVWLA